MSTTKAFELDLSNYNLTLQAGAGQESLSNGVGNPRIHHVVGNFGVFGTTLEKALPTGGLANVTFGDPTNQGITPGTNIFSNFSQRNVFSGGLTPQWAPNLTFGLQQPLLQGFGTGLNALLPQHEQ